MLRFLLFLFVGSLTTVSILSNDFDRSDLDDPILPDDFNRHGEVKSRAKRSVLSLPANTTLRILLDIFLPVNPLNNTFTSLLLELPFRFTLPTYDDYKNHFGDSKERNTEKELEDENLLEDKWTEEHRSLVYRHVETLFEKFGFNGVNCLQLAICELAHAPLGHHGLLGKLVQLIFSPSFENLTGSKRNIVASQDSLLKKYVEAYRYGQEGLCTSRYSKSCPISLFNAIEF